MLNMTHIPLTLLQLIENNIKNSYVQNYEMCYLHSARNAKHDSYHLFL